MNDTVTAGEKKKFAPISWQMRAIRALRKKVNL